MGYRPFLDLCGFRDRFSQRGARQAITSFVGSDPDQASIELDEDIFRGSPPPGIVVIDFALERRYEPGNFFRLGGVGNVENAYARIEPGDHNHGGSWWGGGGPSTRVLGGKTDAAQTRRPRKRNRRGPPVRGKKSRCLGFCD